MSVGGESGSNGNGANGNGLNGHGLNGHGVELDEPAQPEEQAAPETPEAPLPPPPANVAELLAACSRFVASKYKVALDGTPETLSLIDQYVRDAREAVRERPESLEVVSPAIGAYLGEVMRQTFGAEWTAGAAYEAWRLTFTHVYLAVNPIGLAREALTMSDAEGWNAHLALDPGEQELVEERLAAMPEVDEEEYYLPSTRFDVITAIVETLRAHAEKSGTGDVRFTREDYD